VRAPKLLLFPISVPNTARRVVLTALLLLGFAITSNAQLDFSVTLTGTGCSGNIPIATPRLKFPFPALRKAGADPPAAVGCTVSFPMILPAHMQPMAVSPRLQLRILLPQGASATLESWVELRQKRTIRHRSCRSATFSQRTNGPQNIAVLVMPDGFLPSSGFCGGEMQVSVGLRIQLTGSPSAQQGISIESFELDTHDPRFLTLFPCSL